MGIGERAGPLSPGLSVALPDTLDHRSVHSINRLERQRDKESRTLPLNRLKPDASRVPLDEFTT